MAHASVVSRFPLEGQKFLFVIKKFLNEKERERESSQKYRLIE